MTFRIDYSIVARHDIREIYQYIAYHLCQPEAASRQINHIMEEIRSLEFMPMRYKLYEEEPWNSMGLRVLPVDNYLVFYLLNEANGVVNIVHIMYGGRDISKHFHDIWIKL